MPKELRDAPFSVVYFGNDWFAENRTSSHHIASRLGQTVPLLYIESPGLRAPQATARDLRKLWRKLWATLRLPHPIGERMWHMTLPQIPFRRWAAVRWVNRRLSLFLVRRAIRHLKFERLLSWFVVPHPGFLAGHIGERMTVYYCIDNYSALPGVDPVAVARMDEELSRRADLVFACSEALAQIKSSLNSNVIYSPHGVDAELFARAADPALKPNPRAAGLTHPVVGFFGVLDARIDVSLLVQIARQHPEWTLLLIGRLATDLRELQSLPNVILPGAVPYATLPEWACVFDVCLMPYCKDAFSANANPLKLREYLAAGKPVVSVPMPAVDLLADFVRVAQDNASFIRALELSLENEAGSSPRERMQAVAHMSWDARVTEVIGTVRRELEKLELLKT